MSRPATVATNAVTDATISIRLAPSMLAHEMTGAAAAGDAVATGGELVAGGGGAGDAPVASDGVAPDEGGIDGIVGSVMAISPAARPSTHDWGQATTDRKPTLGDGRWEDGRVNERVAAVVLAAGAGTRFGGGKLLARIDGRPVLQHVIDRLGEAGVTEVVVVLGADGRAIEATIDWRGARRVNNPDPSRGLASSLQVGIASLDAGVERALVVLGDQPKVPIEAVRALVATPVDAARPIVVPRYAADGGRNPVLLERAGLPLVDGATGDRGLGPIMAARPELVREVPVAAAADNPDVDTRDDLVALLESGWATRVRENAAQVDRVREVPDGADFYAPVSGLFRADPTRTDEPALASLLAMVRSGETWLDIGAGAGRYALPIARALAPTGGRVIAVDASGGMLAALRELANEHEIANVDAVELRWPPASTKVFAADVALIAHVGYDIESIGPFLAAMESCARRRCVAVLMEQQPASIADVCWPPVHGEARVSLPALPEFLELLRAMGRAPEVERLEREPRRFASRDELEALLRRQLWVEPGGAKDRRFQAELDVLLVHHDDGQVGLRGQRPLPIGIVSWEPRRTGAGRIKRYP
jgi:molybdenum cofactor cytidylyltransferase